ncbi:hypothetical protein K461DRAFT_281800 [Myriangium duriaei CBS 260.36]|uniref:Uncharacterized protein n=1 Tax=Myriangium duriaei CBS 260.36 TaxID=1168546 RepID=A0A9P4ISX8_9PEZI|nr:hypothetical protein K461DRAFT_281800 [Myriangium duriaei CBS 260.36]
MTGIHREMLGHLVRRGADVYLNNNNDAYVQSSKDQVNASQNPSWQDVQPAAVIVVVFTVLVFLFVYASLKYTLGEVVSTLTMIESPSALAVAEYEQPPPAYKDDENADDPVNKTAVLDETILVVQEKPITSSIRSTIRHLGRIGGFRARWRGLGIAIVYNIAQGIAAVGLRGLFSFFLGPVIGFFLGSIVATVALCRVHMTWTHIMISAPSSLPWYRRIPRGPTYFKTLIIPAAIFAIAQHLTIVLPLGVASMFGGLPDATALDNAVMRNELGRFAALLATAAFVALAILLPATVTLTRVEASLLPDDAETIVSFDRTLGGAAANLVGFGKINFRALYDAAWRSFDKSSRIRLIKFYVKYIAIIFMVDFIFFGIMFAEVAVFGRTGMFMTLQTFAAQG